MQLVRALITSASRTTTDEPAASPLTAGCLALGEPGWSCSGRTNRLIGILCTSRSVKIASPNCPPELKVSIPAHTKHEADVLI